MWESYCPYWEVIYLCTTVLTPNTQKKHHPPKDQRLIRIHMQGEPYEFNLFQTDKIRLTAAIGNNQLCRDLLMTTEHS